MNKRFWKIAALATSGGILLQATGCSTVLTQEIVSLVISQVFNIILQAVLSGAPVV